MYKVLKIAYPAVVVWAGMELFTEIWWTLVNLSELTEAGISCFFNWNSKSRHLWQFHAKFLKTSSLHTQTLSLRSDCQNPGVLIPILHRSTNLSNDAFHPSNPKSFDTPEILSWVLAQQSCTWCYKSPHTVGLTISTGWAESLLGLNFALGDLALGKPREMKLPLTERGLCSSCCCW